MRRQKTNRPNRNHAPIRALALAATIFIACTVLASTRTPSDEARTYRLNLPPLSRVEAVAFEPGQSALALVQWRNLRAKPLSRWKSEYDMVLWDFRTGKVPVRKPFHIVTDWSRDHYFFPRSMSYFDAGRQLAYCGGEDVRIFETSTYSQTALIPVVRTVPPRGDRLTITRCAFSADGNEVAIQLREFHGPPGIVLVRHSPVVIRTYNLLTRQENHEWQFPTYGWDEGLALSPHATQVAWTIMGDNGEPRRELEQAKNLNILDTRTGKLLGIHSNRIEGAVAFTSDGRLLSVPYEAALSSTAHQGIRIWDPHTGKLLGEVHSRPNGVHYHIAVSQNAGVVLGYTGRDRLDENFIDVDRVSFRLWDATSWRTLFTSPVFKPAYTGTPLPPEFSLSLNGHLVALWSPDSAWPRVFVYEIK